MLRVKLQLDKKAICSIGMQAYLGERNGDPTTVYGRLGDMRPAWDGVKEVIFQSNEETFAKEGAKAGFASWHDDYDFSRDRNYLDWKMEVVGHVRLMELTGETKEQLTGKTQTYFEASERATLIIGSNRPTHPGSGLSGQHGINRLDAASEDIAGLQAHEYPHPYVSPKTGEIKVRPAHSIFRFTDGDIDEMCEYCLDHITHARRLNSRFRIRPSTSPRRTGHSVVGPRQWKGRIG